MCKLNFEYQIADATEKMKMDFEERVNKKYSAVCSPINESGSHVIVSWKEKDKSLRGVITLTEEIVKVLQLNSLENQFD